ncbi:MAG: transporter substrate-binding domain-containing protein [Litorilinea sp.]
MRADHEAPERATNNNPGRRPSAVRSFGMAIGVGLLFLIVVFVVARVRGEGDLLRFFLRQDQTWLDMQARGTWRVGMDPSFPPFQSLNEAGEPIGFDVDLAHQLAAAWDMDVEIVALGFDSLLDALQAGRIDSVVSALPHDPRATRDVAYSPPYFEAGIRLAVRPDSALTGADLTPQDSSSTDQPSTDQTSTVQPNAVQTEAELVAALTGLRLAVEWGSMGDMVGRRLHRADATIEVVPFETPDAAIAAAQADTTLDGLLIDNVSLRQAQGQGANLVAVGPAVAGNAYVIAVPVRATTLHDQLTATLTQLIRAGELEQLEARWFGPIE